jgi:hypothetical protein
VTVAVQGSCRHDVLAGAWLDPYTGRVLRFDDLKDPNQAQAIPIDHIVPLAEAHRSGADTWDEQRRTAFANDPANLLTVDAGANAEKGDQDPARWRPVRTSWCAYAIAWISVKDRWQLAVDDAERAALVTMLAAC